MSGVIKGTGKLSHTQSKRKREELDNTDEFTWELFDAISEGNHKNVTRILKEARYPEALLERKDPQGLTPLKKAITLNKAEIARILVANGASPSVKDPVGKTPLHIAVMQGRRELIAPLLVSVDSCVNAQDNAGWTPLHYAIRGKHLKVLEWLLYAGADVNIKNKDDESPEDQTEDDSLMRKMLRAHNVDRELYPVILSSAFISRKNLNYIGTDGLLMFVTSQNWSVHEQFFFCKRIRPSEARPMIPLRWNETFYSDVYHYRTMRRLNQGETRVKLYILFFEALKTSELVLKITSKDQYLGEVPLLRSTYIQDKYTNFMGSCEVDIKAEGQFVMVKRDVALQLHKNDEGVYSCAKYPDFLFDVPQGSVPAPPKDWNTTREERASKERDQMVKGTERIMAALSTVEFLGEFYAQTITHDPAKESEEITPKAVVTITRPSESSAQTQKLENQSQASVNSQQGQRESESGTKSEELITKKPSENERSEEIVEAVLEPMLEAYEEDASDDFYYISKGWGLYLTVMESFPLSILLEVAGKEKEKTQQIRSATNFYYLNHSSDQNSKSECTVQIPKTEEFAKVGTVLVFVRANVAPENESPDPDDSAQEYMLSDDMKTSWGHYWQNQERDRWELLKSGIVNKQSRVIFKTKTLSAFIVVQLTSGDDKSEREEDDSESSEEEEEDVAVGEEGEGGEKEEKTNAVPEGGEEGGAAAAAAAAAATQESGEGGNKSKKKPKKRFSKSSSPPIFQEDFCVPDEDDLEEEENMLAEQNEGEGEDGGEEGAAPEGGESAQVAEPTAEDTGEPGAPNPSPMVNQKEEGNKDENASNVGRPLNFPRNTSNNNSNINEDIAEKNKNNNEIRDNGEDYDQTNLAPEEKTLIVGLPVEVLSFHKLNIAPSVYRPPPKLSEDAEEGQDITDSAEDHSSDHTKTASTEPLPIHTGPMYAGIPEELPVGTSGTFGSKSYLGPTGTREDESDEDLPDLAPRRLSITVTKNGVKKAQDFKYGPKLTDRPLPGVDIEQVKTEIAQMWRYRNHKKTCILIFSRPRDDNGFDMVVDVVQNDDIYVRAESHYSVGFKMVGESHSLAIKTGRLLSFTIEGPLIVDKCDGGVTSYHGNPRTKTMYFSHSQINSLEYVVRKPQVEEVKGPTTKKGKKKEEVKVELEPDARLEAMAFNAGSGTNGVDLAALQVWLNGPDLWRERHVQLRASDNKLLDMLINCLTKSRALARNWWRLLILLGYTEKEVESEKGKTQPVVVVRTYLRKWFEDCLNQHDRGILRLIQSLDTLKLDIAIDNVVRIIKLYKAHLLKEQSRPRYLKLLFHWVLQTKVTRNNLLRLPDPQILRPVSDQFLLHLSDFLPKQHLFKIGGAMDVEENVLHAISQEEIIVDEAYLGFRVLVKSRQKKDEIIHYTLLLMEMLKQVELMDANEFMVRETKKWMETVADTDLEVCSKLENVFG